MTPSFKVYLYGGPCDGMTVEVWWRTDAIVAEGGYLYYRHGKTSTYDFVR